MRIAFLFALLTQAIGLGQDCNDPKDPYRPLPKSVQFPVDRGQVSRWLGFNPFQPDAEPFGRMDVAKLREHVWSLFSGLTATVRIAGQPFPVWATWFRVPEDLNSCGPNRKLKSIAFLEVAQLQGLSLQLTADSKPRKPGLVGHVLYNKSTLSHVLSNKLTDPQKLNGLQQGGSRNVPEFPPESIALKTSWMIVAANGCTALPVWDHDPVNPDGANPLDNWKRSVGVVTTENPSPICEAAESGRPIRRVSISKFYSHPLDDTEAASLQGMFAYYPNPKPGDFLVLVGFHLTTKEIPNWIWGTFWWHDEPTVGEYARQRPTSVKGVWRNYLMDCAYDMDNPRQADGAPKVVYNPYLEGPFFDGTRSNCMTCHRRAAWPLPTARLGALNSLGQQFGLNQIVVRGSEAATASYFPEWPSLLKLDFLWSLQAIATTQAVK